MKSALSASVAVVMGVFLPAALQGAALVEANYTISVLGSDPFGTGNVLPPGVKSGSDCCAVNAGADDSYSVEFEGATASAELDAFASVAPLNRSFLGIGFAGSAHSATGANIALSVFGDVIRRDQLRFSAPPSPFDPLDPLTVEGFLRFDGKRNVAVASTGPTVAAAAQVRVDINGKVTWGGITSVTHAATGMPIENWTVTSASGFDYTQVSSVPEPSSALLLAVGSVVCLCLAPRHRQRVKAASGARCASTARERAGLERLLRYCARPPFALERLEQVGDD